MPKIMHQNKWVEKYLDSLVDRLQLKSYRIFIKEYFKEFKFLEES